MTIFKCKMCGGSFEIANNETVATCEYCGTQQTLPKLNDDRRANLYDRANHFRRNNEFDKAMGIYEQILNEDTTDAEAYWSLVLCRYGIEYVEDPSSHKRVPTVNRAQFTAVFDDDNYKSALRYSDSYQRTVYEEEAKAINEIQKGILTISQNEEPFDVFICYKETDNTGRRTLDSVLANELYHQLTQEGFKVFFSRIILEDKLGSAYEPYIFAALNSAKVMVVLGTKPEYFKAVWVRNEWSRYLSLIKQGQKKILVPAYRDMDPYDLPEEFSHLQAQDMSKLGFMQDLIRGIQKITQIETPKASVVKETVATEGGVNIVPLLKRVFLFLEDGAWSSADEYCEKVLDVDPENAIAYLGKLMAEFRVRKQEELKNCTKPFDERNNYKKAVRFADEKLKEELSSYIDHINTRNENARMKSIYDEAKKNMNFARDEESYKKAAELFEALCDYMDSAKLAKECYFKAEIARKETIYEDACNCMDMESIVMIEGAVELFKKILDWKDSDEKIQECYEKIERIKIHNECARKDNIYDAACKKASKESIASIEAAIEGFESVYEWRDSEKKIEECREKILTLQRRMEKERIRKEKKEEEERLERERKAILEQKKVKKIKRTCFIVCILLCMGVSSWFVINKIVIPNNKYKAATQLMMEEKYEDALEAFKKLSGYKDSNKKIGECKAGIYETKYEKAFDLLNQAKYEEALNAFEEIIDYRDSSEMILECRYREGMDLLNQARYVDAIIVFEEIFDYKDSSDKILECNKATLDIEYEEGLASIEEGNYVQAAMKLGSLDGHSAAMKRSFELWENITERKTIAVGHWHTVGLYEDGTVVATGSNDYGQCNVGKWKDIVAISAGSTHTVGLRADGTVVATGSNDHGQCSVSSWKNIVAISAGHWHTVGLRADGTVVVAGSNDEGQGDVDYWKNIVSISAGYQHTVGLRADGTVVAAGSNECGENNVQGWKRIVSINAGLSYTTGILEGGQILAVGYNYSGQCDIKEWSGIKELYAGFEHTVGLKDNGTVVSTVSYNAFKQCNVEDWNNIVDISVGNNHTVGLQADGTVVATGYNHNGECDISSWKNIKVTQ